MSLGKILIVEDEAHLAEGISLNLENEGFEVEVIDDGVAADEMLVESRFDLVVLDVMLPGIDGFEICERIRQQDRQQPVIMLTAKSADEDIVQGLSLGADDYVAKPFSVT
ncbi:MAG: response regulator, partial [Holophagales bacterium]|nr:response regulator [Holophagales bacterium]